MLRVALAMALVLAALAGCGSTTSDDGGAPIPPARGPAMLDCGIANWNETCLALASFNDSPSKAEVDIAVNPADPNNVFVASKDLDRQASDCVWSVGQYTKDGGRHWNTTYVGGALDARASPAHPLYGWQCVTDPILAFEPDGTLHYSLQAYDYRPPTISDPTCTGSVPVVPPPCLLPQGGFMFQAVSHDGGATFPPAEIKLLHGGDERIVFHDFMRAGASPTTGTMFTIWDQLTAGAGSLPVLVAVEHGAASARPPVYFPNPDPDLESLGVGAVIAGRDGTVYAWLSGFNSNGRAVLATSADDGRTFSVPTQAFTWTPMKGLEKHPCGECPTYKEPDWCPSDPGIYTPCYRHGTLVELAVDASDAGQGCLYAAWGGAEAGSVGGSDIYVRSSCDQGASWGEPVLVNAAHRQDGQWMPRVSVDGHGVVHLVYFTRAYDPEHNLIDAEHAYSADGGRNWTAERLTSKGFDGNLGMHQGHFPFIGDYIGISSVGDHTWMAFPDTISGRAEIVAAHSVYMPEHVHPAG